MFRPRAWPGEYQFLEIIEDQFGRTVFIALDLIDDDFHFLVYFLLRIRTVEYDVGQQFCGA